MLTQVYVKTQSTELLLILAPMIRDKVEEYLQIVTIKAQRIKCISQVG